MTLEKLIDKFETEGGLGTYEHLAVYQVLNLMNKACGDYYESLSGNLGLMVHNDEIEIVAYNPDTESFKTVASLSLKLVTPEDQ
jgi:hypothetical protein